MTATPWGNSDELRSRRLRPGPAADRELVERNQRERLMAATVAAIEEHGYEATRVADLVELSGVSRSAFYKYFEDKPDCFLQTVDTIAEIAIARIAEAFADEASWDRRLRAATDAFLELVLAQPAAARLCLVEVYAAGPAAIERLEQATGAVERAVSQAIEESPDRAGMPRDIVRAVVGGLNKAIHTRLRRREEADLAEVVPQLFEWAMSYHTPPEKLPHPRRRPDRGAAPRHIGTESRERLVRAVTDSVAERGYPDATIAELVDRAKASLSTFYDNFPSKEEAFGVAVQQAHADAVAAALPPYLAAGDWRRGIRDGLDALFGFLAAEPAAASIGAVEVLAAGAEGLAQGDRAIEGIHAYLAPAYKHAPGTAPLVGEAIGGAIYTLVYSQVRRRRTERMRELSPTATYVALTPFVGPSEACAIAVESLTARH